MGETVNIVLVGKTGNGKSATANSILMRERAFESNSSFECQQQMTMFNGRALNLIDTPGLFDSSHDADHHAWEIARCVSMADGGIHAVLLVVPLTKLFTNEDRAAVEKFQYIFGAKLCDYMIVVFTHGDDLDDEELGLRNPFAVVTDSLMAMVDKCGKRHVIFDNKTKDDGKKYEQIEQLLKLVDGISHMNGSEPYTNDFFLEYQRAAEMGSDEFGKAKQDQMQSCSSMILSKLTNLEEETRKLREELGRTREEKGGAENAENRFNPMNCSIM